VRKQALDGERMCGLHEQRPRSVERQRALAVYDPDHRVLVEVARHRTHVMQSLTEAKARPAASA